MPLLVDLVRQVRKVLLPANGGTGNPEGWAHGTLVVGRNRTGGTIAVGSLVRWLHTWDDTRITPVTTADDVRCIGVVVGSFADDGVTFSTDAPADRGYAAVLTAGIADVLISQAVTRGQYLYASGTSGQAYSSATRKVGAMGWVMESASSGSARCMLQLPSSIAGSEQVTRYGTAQDTTDFQYLDIQQGLHEHGSATRVALEVDQPGLQLAAAQVAVADAGGYFDPAGASGAESLYPVSDIVNTPSGYSSGSTSYTLIDEAVVSTADWVDLKAVAAYIRVGMGASALSPTARIASVDLEVHFANPAPTTSASFRVTDPATGTDHQLSAIAQNASSPITVNKTTRPWDSRPWTLADVANLQLAVQAAGTLPNLRVYRMRAIVNFTVPENVETALQELGADVAGKMSNPMSTAEDLIVGGTLGAPTRLGVGGEGQVLMVTGGAVAWDNSPSGFSNPMTDVGSLIVGDTGGAAVELPAGAADQVLTMISGSPAWQDPGGTGSSGPGSKWFQSVMFR